MTFKEKVHTVVRTDGTIGGYNRGAEAKKKLLARERAQKELGN